MNADRLLHAVSVIGEAPARVQQLRQVVVALAIADKLGSASDALSTDGLLREVENVKAELYRQGSIPKPKSFRPVKQGDLPEAFPDAPHFARLGSLARVVKGQTGIKQAQPGPFPLVVTGAERASCDHFDFEGAAAIIPLVSSTGHGNASLARLHYEERKFALGTILAAVLPYEPALVSARFLFEYLSAFKEDLLVARMTGTANVTLSVARIEEVPVPLVSPSTQARVDELMTLLDQLEAARTAREAARDRLAVASLARLQAPSPETLAEDGRSVLNVLPALTSRPDQIKAIRQAILSLAVRGELVAQNPTDQPASELLKRIATDRKERAASARDRRAGLIEPLDYPDAPYSVPQSWLWVRFGDITISRDGERVPVPKAERDNRAKIHDYYGASGVIDKIDGYLFDKPLLLIAEDGANLINRSTPVAFIARGKYWVNNHAHVIDGLNEQLLRYLELFINATDLKPFVTGTAQPKMNQAKMNGIPIAVPPLAEQHRIVARVDALMDLCDRLKTALTAAETARARVLGALVHEALAPVCLAHAA